MKYYIGKYKEEILIMDENKDICKYYMKTIRNLNIGEYDIIEESLEDEDLIKYEDVLTVKFYKVYLPNRDIAIINHEFNKMISNIDETINTLSNILIPLLHIKKSKKKISDGMNIADTIKLLKDIKSGNKYYNIEELYKKNHPILFFNIIEYLYMIKLDVDVKEMINKYKVSVDTVDIDKFNDDFITGLILKKHL